MAQEVIAKGNNLRISPKKLALIADLVRGKNAHKAIETLKFTQKKGAKLVNEVLNQGIANAKNNFGMDTQNLIIKEIFVNKGLDYKRGRPVARGRYFQIIKRGSNLTIKLKQK